jgi:hypothetical protein
MSIDTPEYLIDMLDNYVIDYIRTSQRQLHRTHVSLQCSLSYIYFDEAMGQCMRLFVIADPEEGYICIQYPLTALDMNRMTN